MKKKALITGITGQDGGYLAELLIIKGYEVFGMARRSSTPNLWRIKHILDDLTLVEGDLTDQESLFRVMEEVQPDEVYNLAAQSFVGVSWSQAELTANVTGLGALRVLTALHRVCPEAKFYQAGSSEQFGKVQETPQQYCTPFYPRSPYGNAKVFAHWTTLNFRESYNMYAVVGLLFNHESPRRGIEFVTRKITDAVARIKQGKQDELRLGNLDARRDWGHSRDYVQAMWMMLQQSAKQETLMDFVIGSGHAHSVRDFCCAAFSSQDLDYHDYVTVDLKFFRPAEVDILLADPRRARELLGWEAQTTFSEMVTEMVDADMARVRREK